MPTTITVSTELNAPVGKIRDHLMHPRSLLHASKGVLKFKPVAPAQFPNIWIPGAYRVELVWKGFLPVGWQMIVIEIPPAHDGVFRLRDNGYGPMIKRWDHMIELRASDSGAHYTDRLTLEAGVLTPFIALFARRFYAHRQKRWRRLIAKKFRYKG